MVFIWLGRKFPSYARFALQLNSGRIRNPLVLVSDIEPPPDVLRLVRWVKLGDFYESSYFTHFREFSNLDEEFRDGFWLKTVERMFVLEQLSGHLELTEFFSAELDVLLFPLDRMVKELRDQSPGLYAPREGRTYAVFSLFYVSLPSAVRDFCDFAVLNADLGVEMTILAAFQDAPNSPAFALPTGSHLLNENNFHERNLQPTDIGGVVDGIALGMWIFGADPRNSSRPVYNKSLATLPEPLDASQWEFKLDGNDLFVGKRDQTLGMHRIYALHVHSKIFKKLRAKGSLEKFFSPDGGVLLRVVSPNRGKLPWVLTQKILRWLRERLWYKVYPRYSQNVKKIPRPLLGRLSQSARLLAEGGSARNRARHLRQEIFDLIRPMFSTNRLDKKLPPTIAIFSVQSNNSSARGGAGSAWAEHVVHESIVCATERRVKASNRPNLPETLRQIRDVLKKNPHVGGVLVVSAPPSENSPKQWADLSGRQLVLLAPEERKHVNSLARQIWGEKYARTVISFLDFPFFVDRNHLEQAFPELSRAESQLLDQEGTQFGALYSIWLNRNLPRNAIWADIGHRRS